MAYNKEYNKEYYEAHKKEKKAYYEAHKDEILAKKKARHVLHPEAEKENAKRYYNSHRDEIGQHKKEYHIENRDREISRMRDYYKSHADDIKEKNAIYRAEHAIDIICNQCGKSARADRYTSGKFCSHKCYEEWSRGCNSTLWTGGPKSTTCEICGEPITYYPGQRHNRRARFCSNECFAVWYSGPNNPHWKGGITPKPYCAKFNTSLKEMIRENFGRKCFLSGKEEAIGNRLAVHHCDYLKSQGCQGQRWSLLPLDHSWHARTNHNRWYWFALLRDYWAYKYLTFHGMDIFEGPDRTTWLWEMYNLQ